MKCRNLEEVRREVETIKDRLEEPIDSKIKDLVIGLRRWGIKTEASCQGHLLKGLPYPWVDVSWESTKDLAKLVGLRTWVIKPFSTFVRLIPESKGERWNIFKLLRLQRDTIAFGKFLQDIPDHYFKGESS
ncbi:MAG: hypothetical protein Q8N73_01780 [bacterium]|nr:hypothetical protein [bacterium]